MGRTNIRFLSHNILDKTDVTTTYSSQDANLPGDNIRDDLRTKVWRTTGKNAEWVQFASVKRLACSCFAIANTNLSGNADIIVRGDDDPANLVDNPPIAPAYEETFKAYETIIGFGEGGFGEHGFGGVLLPEEMPLYITIIRYFSEILETIPGIPPAQGPGGSSVLTGGLGGGPILTGGMGGEEMGGTPDTYESTGRYERIYKAWRIKFVDPSNTNAYLDFGKIFIGPYFEPATGFAFNWDMVFVDPSRTEYSLGGQALSDIMTPYNICNLGFNKLVEWEIFYNFRRLVQEFGTHKDFFINLIPDTAKYRILTALYGRFVENRNSFKNYSNGLYSCKIPFRESV